MLTTGNFRPALLAVLILLASIVNNSRAQAGANETLIVAGGCFWCVEADFEKVKGVKGVVSGYSGGTTKNPGYKQVTSGGTGHFEAVRITFDPSVVTRAQLLHMFLRSVDPTDAGGQFCDRGDSYRTAIFAGTRAERDAATAAIRNAQSDLGQKVVTPILPEAPFYPAEAYHQDYYKSGKIILTRYGPKSKASAYKLYRKSCGRDERVRQLWGSSAPFAGG